MIITSRNRHGFGPALKHHKGKACRCRIFNLGSIGGASAAVELFEPAGPRDKVCVVLLSQIHLYRVRLCIASAGGRAAAFLAAAKKSYFWRASTVCLCSACTVCEMLKNAPSDAAIAVDTAENQLFNVKII